MRKLEDLTPAEYLLPAAPPSGAGISIRPHPLKTATKQLAAPAGMTVAEALYQHGFGYALLPSANTSIIVDRFDGTGLELSKADCFTFTPLPGDLISVRVLPGKGGGGKSPLATLVSVAFMAASFFAPPAWAMSAGLGIFEGVGGMSLGTALTLGKFAISGGIMLAGMAVTSFLVSPPTTDIRSAGGSVGEETSTTYAITGSSNKLNRWGVVPQMVGGSFRVYPCHGAEPYTEIRGQETWLRQKFVMIGPVKVEDMRIGETPLTDYSDYEVEVREGWSTDVPSKLYSNAQDVHQEALSVALTQAAGWISRRTNADADEIIFDVSFSRLYVVNQSTGKYGEATVNFEAEYSLAGANDWHPFADAETSALSISGKYTSAYSQSFHMFAGGQQYDIRWRRTTADDTTGYTFDAMAIATLRTITARDPINRTSDLPPLCEIDLLIKGSGQLNGVIDQFNFLGSAYLPVWDEGTEAYVWQVSDVPAWAYVNILRGPGNKKPVADSLIDIPTMLEWAAQTDTWGLHINALVDAKTTVRELLLKVARVGRASPGKRDNLHSVVIDNVKTTYAQVLSPRNSWGFEGKVQLPDPTHAVRCSFNNKDKNYVQDERIVYAPGYTESTASKFEELELWGVDDSDEAWKAGQFHMANVRLRPEEFNAWMDWESLLCRRGSLIKMVHDVPLLGIGQGIVKAVEYYDEEADPPDLRVTAITVDSAFTMTAGTDYACAVRLSTGVLITSAVVTQAGEQSRLVMPVGEPIPAAAAPQVGDLLVFSEAERIGEDLLVVNIERGDDFTARLTLRHYAPGVQTADSGTIPAFVSNITRTSIGGSAAPGTPIIDDVVSDESVLVRLADGSLLPRIMLSFSPRPGVVQTAAFQAQAREQNGEWRVLPSIPAESRSVSISDVEEGQTYDLRLRAVSAFGAVSEWAYLNDHTVIGKTSPPPDVPGLLVDGRVLRWSYPAPPLDFSGFRLAWNQEVNTAWATATPLHAGDWQDTLFTLPDIAGTITVLLRAVDVAGNLSTGTSQAVLNLGDVIPDNILETIPLVTTPVEAEETTAAWGADTSPAWPRPDGAAAWEQAYAALGYEVSVMIDSALDGAGLKLDMDAAGNGLLVEYRTDSQAPAWDDGSNPAWNADAESAWPISPEWKPWPGSLESVQDIPHYFKISSNAGPVQGVINSLDAIFDVPDLEEIIEDVTILTTGTRLPLTKTYRRIKHIGITLQDNGLGATGVRVVDKNATLGPLLEAIGANALIDARPVGY